MAARPPSPRTAMSSPAPGPRSRPSFPAGSRTCASAKARSSSGARSSRRWRTRTTKPRRPKPKRTWRPPARSWRRRARSGTWWSVRPAASGRCGRRTPPWWPNRTWTTSRAARPRPPRGRKRRRPGSRRPTRRRRFARANLENTVIRAPFTGTVLRKEAEIGEVVAPSVGGGLTRGAVVTMADLRTLEVEVDVNEAYISRVPERRPREDHARRLSRHLVPR